MNIINVKENEFEEIIKNETVLVDFYADWCGPCKMMSKVIDDLSNEINDVKFAKVNVDIENKLASKYSVMSIPTLILFKNGNMVKKMVGFHSKDELIEFIKN